jgi:hypothetical protein
MKDAAKYVITILVTIILTLAGAWMVVGEEVSDLRDEIRDLTISLDKTRTLIAAHGISWKRLEERTPLITVEEEEETP